MGNTVTVCLEGTARTCGGAVPMLRQDEATGTVVELGDACENNCYVDECVPPGKYRYGFATPFDCSEAGCGTGEMFAEAEISSAIAGCTPTSGNPGPTPTPTAAPWGTGSDISTTNHCDGHGCTTAPGERRGVFSFDMLANALSYGAGGVVLSLVARVLGR
jgi:hypothetical protein